MRITIETTEAKHPTEKRSASVFVNDDHLTILDVADQMRRVLVAWGFHPDSVAEIFAQEDE